MERRCSPCDSRRRNPLPKPHRTGIRARRDGVPRRAGGCTVRVAGPQGAQEPALPKVAHICVLHPDRLSGAIACQRVCPPDGPATLPGSLLGPYGSRFALHGDTGPMSIPPTRTARGSTGRDVNIFPCSGITWRLLPRATGRASRAARCSQRLRTVDRGRHRWRGASSSALDVRPTRGCVGSWLDFRHGRAHDQHVAGANATDAGGLQDGRQAADHERRKGRPRDVGVGLFGNPGDDHDGQDHRCDDHGGRLQPAPHGDESWQRLVRLVANVVVFAVERDQPSPPVVELLVRTRARPDHPSNGVPAQILTRNWPDLGAPADPGARIPGQGERLSGAHPGCATHAVAALDHPRGDRRLAGRG